jgi:hypothetical protein
MDRPDRDPSTPRARARHGLAIGLAALAFLVLALLAISASAIVHLATPLGREAARDGFVAYLSSRIRGTAHVDEMTHLDFDGMEVRNFWVTAPNGERVIQVDRMAGRFDFGEVFKTGYIQMIDSVFDVGTVRITEGPGGQVNLVHAMEVPDDRWVIPVQLRDIRLIDQTMIVSLPGKPAVTMREVHGLADLHVGHRFLWRMDQNRGWVDLPLGIEGGFRHMSGRLQSDNVRPLIVQMLLDLELAEPGARLDYTVPALAGREGEPYFELSAPYDIGVSDAEDDCAEGDEEECEEREESAKPEGETEEEEERRDDEAERLEEARERVAEAREQRAQEREQREERAREATEQRREERREVREQREERARELSEQREEQRREAREQREERARELAEQRREQGADRERQGD